VRSKRWRLLLLIIPILLPIVLLANHHQETQRLFSQPSNFSQFTDLVNQATYEINCDRQWLGSGWGLKLENRYFVVTAEHVITDCVNDGRIYARRSGGAAFELELISYDGRYWTNTMGNYRDLALLETRRAIPVFEVQKESPVLGQWVATAGFPSDGRGSENLHLNLGTITSLSSDGLLTTDATINNGNSGGPLLNSKGQVVGTIFASPKPSRFVNMSLVQSMELHCQVVFACVDRRPGNLLPPKKVGYPSQRS
jgi:S1-C subfamily serine protease